MKTDKPPFQVPTMSEIAVVPDSGLRVVSFFSGCGGSCLGFRMAGFKVLWASEFIPAAQETYHANHPTTTLDGRDIRTVQPKDILSATGLKIGELDCLEGSPPCSSFSTAGKRQKHWGKTKSYSDTAQRTDDLFFEYVRILEGLQPRVFVAENVSGLVKGVAKGYFLEILRRLKACGYHVGCKVLDAQWLGVPQARQRTIFIGVREDLGRDPTFPKPLPYRYSLREAIPWIVKVGGIRQTGFASERLQSSESPSPTIMAGGGAGMNMCQFGVEAVIHDTKGQFPSAGDVTDRPCPTVGVTNRNQFEVRLRGGTGTPFTQKRQAFDLDRPAPTILGAEPNQVEVDMSGYAIAREWDKLKPGESSDKYFNLVRPHPDAPCPTILASHGHPGIASVTHPTEKRKLTIAELKRICGFPDDFVLTGTYSQQWERLGRAVPPVMMFHIARTIRDEILA